MKIIIYFIIYLFLCQSNLNAQVAVCDWVKRIGGTYTDEGYSIAVDGSGNVYTTGSFTGTVDFDPGPGVFNLTSAGGLDIFVCKLSASGNFIWAKRMGSSSDDWANSITIDASGNVYTTGCFHGTADFDPGPGTCNLTSAGGSDIFISKLDSSGNFLWAKRMGGNNADLGVSIKVDTWGNIYSTGTFCGTADFDPGPLFYNFTSAGSGVQDVFISKLDSSGNFIWAKQIGGTLGTIANCLAIDETGNIYTTGFFCFTVDFDPGPGTYYLTQVGSNNTFILKLTSSGNFNWAKQMEGGANFGESIDIDTQSNLYLGGYFSNTVDFDPGNGIYNLTSAGGTDIFISKLDSSGNLMWANHLGGPSNDNLQSLSVDLAGNIYFTGVFYGSGLNNFVSFGGSDLFIGKLEPVMGNLIWAKHIGGISDDYGRSIVVTIAGTIYTTGLFSSSVDFNQNSGSGYNLTSMGGRDIFILKLIQCNSTNSFSTFSACNSYISPSGNYTWGTSGIYYDTLVNSQGCDSLMTINLTIHNSTSNTLNTSFCDSYTSPGGNYTWTTSGIYTDTLVNSVGCDSIITINLQIVNSSSNTLIKSKCDSYTSPSGNYTWTSSGTYYDTIPNSQGCDSVLTINLTILNSTYDTISSTTCNGYTSPSGNYTWATSGTYYDTIPNSLGCDSILTIQLTILNSTSDTISPTTCNSYTSPSGNFTWTSSGTYYDTIPNSQGCDSIITINLTVNASSTNQISPYVCNSYTSPSGNYTWNTSGSYSDTIPNSLGCDSVITVNLIVNTVDSTITNDSPTLTSNATGAGYQWMYCDSVPVPGGTGQSFTATANGSYAVIIHENGCIDTSACITVSNVGIWGATFPEGVCVYPVPFHDHLYIDAASLTGTIEITLSDSRGNMISKSQAQPGLIDLNIRAGQGMYFLILFDHEKSYKMKVMKD